MNGTVKMIKKINSIFGIKRCGVYFGHRFTSFALALLAVVTSPVMAEFVTFESGQVRPLAMSADGARLYAVNTPDNQLEIFDIRADGLVHTASVPVGLEPVAVAVNGSQVWVVNHLSDSVSIVDVATATPRVVETLWVGDEPRDIVFAGQITNRFAFVSTAHRGQNSPYSPDVLPDDPGEVTQPGIGRADVWVFHADSPAAGAINIISLFADTPRSLAVSPDGGTVYAAGFQTGNKTASINEGAVCDGGFSVLPCNVLGVTAPGGLPAPNANILGNAAPETGLIVKYDGTKWTDELNRNWNNQVMFNLPDYDVFVIDANSSIPSQINAFSGVGTILFNMISNPVSGKIYVTNTEANNATRFEGTRSASSYSSVNGHLHESRITVISPFAPALSVEPRHLNKHINYNIVPSPAGIKERSLATPMGMAISSNGQTLYVAAFGSSKLGVFNTGALENDTFIPDAAEQIPVSGGGPTGLVLDEVHQKLYVMTRFDNSISIINTQTRQELSHLALHNPEPADVIAGRPFLYDANLTSSNGEASCASCHVFGDFDSLAWDLGDPEGVMLSNPNPSGPINGSGTPYHPLKGPMTTQSLRGLSGQGPLHWRGDRTAAHSGGDPLDTAGAFREFNVAFVGLLGRDSQLPIGDMVSFTNFVMQITYPPNPNRPLDNSLTPRQQAGNNFFRTQLSTAGFLTCNQCHLIDPANLKFGSSGLMSFEAETQNFKIAHLRNMYQKVGMFGMPNNTSIVPGDNVFMGNQVRGFGFIHDGSVDNLFRFHGAPLFSFPGGESQRRDVEQFMLAMDTNLPPITGQQVTLDSSNNFNVMSRIDLLIQRASFNEIDLVVKANIGGQQHGWIRLGNGTFMPDSLADGNLSRAQLENIAQVTGQELTFMAVPAGSGNRIGLDRDDDGVLNRDDVCPAGANPDQLDNDGDGIGDVCDNCINIANASQRDSNGDGYGNMCDADLNNDNIVNALDLGLFKQAFFTFGDLASDLNGDGVVNSLDLGVFRSLFLKQPGPSALVH